MALSTTPSADVFAQTNTQLPLLQRSMTRHLPAEVWLAALLRTTKVILKSPGLHYQITRHRAELNSFGKSIFAHASRWRKPARLMN